MKALIFTLFLSVNIAFCTHVLAQHNPHYSQFMFNKLTINPAYAGSKETLSLMALYRYQWEGLIGSPRTMNFNIHVPVLNKRVGLGLNLVSDEIGMVGTDYITGMYSYRLKMKNKDVLSGGIALRVTNSRIDWSKALILHQEDSYVPMDRPNLTSLNIGFGAYYSSENYYVGLSIPAILKKSDFGKGVMSQDMIKDLRTYYLMGGFLVHINDFISLKPSCLVSYIPTAPFDLDLNMSVIFFNSFWIGATYRMGDSVDAVLQYSVNNQLMIGVAADYTLSSLNDYTPGSLELSLEYVFRSNKTNRRKIRFFD